MFFYTNQGSAPFIDGVEDGEDLLETREAFLLLGESTMYNIHRYTHIHTHIHTCVGCLHGLTGSSGSGVGHRSVVPRFKPWPDCIRKVFHLSLRLITFGGCSAHYPALCTNVTFKQVHLYLYMFVYLYVCQCLFQNTRIVALILKCKLVYFKNLMSIN